MLATTDIPLPIIEGVRRYVENHIRPGSFLYTVLCNDLGKAVSHADPVNAEILPEIVRYVNDAVPPECYGSPGEVDAWLAGRPMTADDLAFCERAGF